MSKGGQKTTTRTRLDPQSQGFVDLQRELATQGALGLTPEMFQSNFDTMGAFQQNLQGLMNPFTSQVIGGLEDQAGRLRQQSNTQAAQQAARLGAFGGAGHGIQAGVQGAEIDRNLMQQTGGLLSNQFNTASGQALGLAEQQRLTQLQNQLAPLQAAQSQLGLTNMGLGPTGQTQTQRQPGGSLLGGLLGTGLSLFSGPLAGLIGGGAQALTGGGGGGLGLQPPGGGFNLAPPGLNNTPFNPYGFNPNAGFNPNLPAMNLGMGR